MQRPSPRLFLTRGRDVTSKRSNGSEDMAGR